MKELKHEIKSSVLSYDWYRIKLMCLLKIHLRPGLSTKNDIRRKKKNNQLLELCFNYLSSCQSQNPTTSNGNLTIPTLSCLYGISLILQVRERKTRLNALGIKQLREN